VCLATKQRGTLTLTWLERMSASSGDLSWFRGLAPKGEEKLKSKDRRIIQEAQELGGSV